MTSLSYLGRDSHKSFRTHRQDPEPRLDELLNDPILHALMASDGVTRAHLEQLIEHVRRRLRPGDDEIYAAFEGKLLLEFA
jgi:hypothetical protein